MPPSELRVRAGNRFPVFSFSKIWSVVSMKFLRIAFMVAITSFVVGCGPGGPPPVVEPENVDPLEDVDVGLEESLNAEEEMTE